jgi:hypothetical protein
MYDSDSSGNSSGGGDNSDNMVLVKYNIENCRSRDRWFLASYEGLA